MVLIKRTKEDVKIKEGRDFLYDGLVKNSTKIKNRKMRKTKSQPFVSNKKRQQLKLLLAIIDAANTSFTLRTTLDCALKGAYVT